jgi:hypothetical protein
MQRVQGLRENGVAISFVLDHTKLSRGEPCVRGPTNDGTFVVTLSRQATESKGSQKGVGPSVGPCAMRVKRPKGVSSGQVVRKASIRSTDPLFPYIDVLRFARFGLQDAGSGLWRTEDGCVPILYLSCTFVRAAT